MNTLRPLRGWRVVSTALNVPGPVAVARLVSFGATALKIEPPAGDPLAHYCRDWYDILHTGIEIERLDLKLPEGRSRLDEALSHAAVLVTAQRPAALARLGLDWKRLHERVPRLSQVAIVGASPPRQDQAGHDLTYAAAEGLVNPPALPRSLVVDLAGAERVVCAALAACITCASASPAGPGLYIEVALEEVAHALAAPLRHRLTAPGAVLGGGFPGYRLYRSRDGWVAVAALEPQFFERLCRELREPELGSSAQPASSGDPRPGAEPRARSESRSSAGSREDQFATIFATRTAAEWEGWGRAHDLPIVAVREPPSVAPLPE